MSRKIDAIKNQRRAHIEALARRLNAERRQRLNRIVLEREAKRRKNLERKSGNAIYEAYETGIEGYNEGKMKLEAFKESERKKKERIAAEREKLRESEKRDIAAKMAEHIRGIRERAKIHNAKRKEEEAIKKEASVRQARDVPKEDMEAEERLSRMRKIAKSEHEEAVRKQREFNESVKDKPPNVRVIYD